MIEKAIKFAVKAHEGQKRKGTDIPYIMHPMEAATIAASIKYDPDLICAALLHDTIEDAGVSTDTLSSMFGDRVADLVHFQSEDKTRSWQERKQDTIDKLNNSTDEDAKIVCLSDKLANLRSISNDYQILGDSLWSRFNAEKEKQVWYYRGLCDALASLGKYIAYREFSNLVDAVFGDI